MERTTAKGISQVITTMILVTLVDLLTGVILYFSIGLTQPNMTNEEVRIS